MGMKVKGADNNEKFNIPLDNLKAKVHSSFHVKLTTAKGFRYPCASESISHINVTEVSRNYVSISTKQNKESYGRQKYKTLIIHTKIPE